MVILTYRLESTIMLSILLFY